MCDKRLKTAGNSEMQKRLSHNLKWWVSQKLKVNVCKRETAGYYLLFSSFACGVKTRLF